MSDLFSFRPEKRSYFNVMRSIDLDVLLSRKARHEHRHVKENLDFVKSQAMFG